MIVMIRVRVVVGVLVVACILGMMLLVPAGQGIDACGGDDDGAVVAGGFDQTVDPALETQAVEHDQVGIGEQACIGRRRIEDMDVLAGADQGLDTDALAAHDRDHVAQDAEAGHDIDRFIGAKRSRRGHRDSQGGRGKENAAGKGHLAGSVRQVVVSCCGARRACAGRAGCHGGQAAWKTSKQRPRPG